MLTVKSHPRLVRSPVFVLSAQRSGSTLLRSILDTHSQIHAPTELTLTEVGVEFKRFPTELGLHTVFTELAFGAAGWDTKELEYVLWDRILHCHLAASGKSVLVHKAPRVLLQWQRLAECWPEARYIFLLRHPMSILTSGHSSGVRLIEWNQLQDYYVPFLCLLQEARQSLPGLTVRYEDLTADPGPQCHAICDYLGLDWEPQMIDYGAADHGPIAAGTGDVSANISTGHVQRGRPLPPSKEVPFPLRPICASLGYA